MIRYTRLWTSTLAVAALMALPISSGAQSYPPAGQQSGQSGQNEGQSSKSPSYHLDQARKVLDRIEESSLTGSSASTVRELKQNFEQLRAAYSGTSGGAAMSGTSGTGTSGTAGTSGSGTLGSGRSGAASGDWRQSFSKVQQSLDQLNVPKSTAWMPITGATSGTSGTGAGGSGSGSMSSTSSIDPAVMTDLKEFRRHVEEFYKAASGSFGD